MQSRTYMLSAFTGTKTYAWRLLLTILLIITALSARAVERWQTLPPTPAPIPSEHSGHVEANGISIYYAMYGARLSDNFAARRPGELGLVGQSDTSFGGASHSDRDG